MTSQYPKHEFQDATTIHNGQYNRIAALERENADLKAQLSAIQAALPDNFSPSKDWLNGNVIERIEWLKGMYRDAAWQLEECFRQIEMLDDKDMPSVSNYAIRYRDLLTAAADVVEGQDEINAQVDSSKPSYKLSSAPYDKFVRGINRLRAMLAMSEGIPCRVRYTLSVNPPTNGEDAT